MKQIIITVLIFVFVSSCGQSPEQIALAAQATIGAIPTSTLRATHTFYPTYTYYPTNTAYPTYTLYPTFTPLPTNTPTITETPTPKFTATNSPTPTDTPTPTYTPTPFNISGCMNFKFSSGLSGGSEGIYAEIKPYAGKCVRLYYEKYELYGIHENVMGDDLVYAVKINIVLDNQTPQDVKKPDVFGRVWGILEEPSTKGGPWNLYLRKSEVLADNQLPINDEGRYLVGKEQEMSPGTWKSGVDPTWNNNCYWAKLNPSTGDIINNYFGIGGITVRLSEGVLFETNSDCTTWYYIGP